MTPKWKVGKIYLAGKWEEYEKIHGYADDLRTRGFEITCPWFERHVGENINLAEGALDDERGVVAADYCIFIFENNLPYSGAMTELGIAIALKKHIFIVGKGGDRNIFTHLPRLRKHSSFEEARKDLYDHARCYEQK